MTSFSLLASECKSELEDRSFSRELSGPRVVEKLGVRGVEKEPFDARLLRFGIEEDRGADDSVRGNTSATSCIAVVNVTLSTMLPVA